MRLVLASALILLAGCQTQPKLACAFEYNAEMEALFVEALKQHFGEGYKFFNSKRPTVTEENGRIELLAFPTLQINGAFMMYEHIFVVAIDPCTKRVIESYDADPPRGEVSPEDRVTLD